MGRRTQLGCMMIVACAFASGCEVTLVERPVSFGAPPPPRAQLDRAPPPRESRPDGEAPPAPRMRRDEAGAELFRTLSAREERPIAALPSPRGRDRAISVTARQEGLPGDAALFGVTLDESAKATHPLAPGCYSVVAHGGLGVLELDLFLSTAGGEARVDERSGPDSVVGGRRGCAELPRGGDLIVAVRKGSGPVTIAIYSEPGRRPRP